MMDVNAARYMATAQIVAAALENKSVYPSGDSAAERGEQLGQVANAVYRYLRAAEVGREKPDA